MDKRRTEWLIPVLLALGAAGALWYYWIQVSRPPAEPVAVPETPMEEPEAMPGPVHPVPATDAPRADRPQLVPLPPLDRSDEYFKLALSDLLGGSIEEMLVETGLIERIVATIDNLPRSHVAERIRPVERIGGQFQVNVRGGDEFTIDSSNYERYVPLVDVLTGADLRAAAEVYRRFYPLFQSAYVDLGYPQGYFNDRLVEVIDHLLGTPEIDDSVPLVRPHVLYEFADPDLEELSSGEKLLIRMGSENRSRVKATLREFRNIVTQM
jgi:hypothetical protein